MHRIGSLRTTRDRLDVQGFCDVDDARLSEAQLGIRFSSALCGAGAAIGTALASPWILLALVATAVAGAIFTTHPFDYIYNFGLRHAIGRETLPPNGAPRRFACAVAAVWLLANAGLFLAGFTVAGYVVGALFVATATWVASTHICPQSIAWTLMFGRPARSAV
jgi:Domain of unknown function (DUF4395)